MELKFQHSRKLESMKVVHCVRPESWHSGVTFCFLLCFPTEKETNEKLVLSFPSKLTKYCSAWQLLPVISNNQLGFAVWNAIMIIITLAHQWLSCYAAWLTFEESGFKSQLWQLNICNSNIVKFDISACFNPVGLESVILEPLGLIIYMV